MSSDITTSAPEKKALTPVVVWTKALDAELDRAETQWITSKQFAEDDRFATVVDGKFGPELRRREASGLWHAAAKNVCGLQQSRRALRTHVPGRGGHPRPTTVYAYPLWRIYKWLGIEDDRRPKPPPAPPIGPLRQSVQFTSPTPQDEEVSAFQPPRPPWGARDLMFISPPSQPDLEICGADSC